MGGLERATRSYGTSVDDVARLTTIINQGFVVSGATAQEASNAVIQLSQGLASGALRGEEFNSVTEQGGRLATALADSLGVNIGQLRTMAAEGKLTTDVVVNGLLSQGDAIGKEFANTTTTIGQALEIANNNITQFIGSSTTVKSTVSLFNSSIITLSENLDIVAQVIGSVATIVGTRYAAALTLAVAGQVKLAATAFAASTSLSAFGAAASLARGALALIGGPAGAAVLAASAIFYFYQRAKEARQAAIDLADGVNTLLGKMKDMSATEIAASIAKLRSAIPELTNVVQDASDGYDKASKRVANLQREVDNWGEGTKRGRQAAEALTGAIDNQNIAFAELEKAQRNLSQTQSAVGIASAQMNGTFEQGIGLLSRHGEQAGFAAGMMNQLGKQLNFAAGAQENFNASSLKITRPKNVQDYLDGLQAQVELQGELNDRKRAQLKAEQQIRKLGGTDADVNLARERAAAEYDSMQAQQQQKKSAKDSASESKKAASQAESVAQKLANLKQQSELAAESTNELSREQAILTAQQSLGKGATQAQITLAGQYAAQKWDTANAIKAQAAAEKLLPEARETASYAQDVKDLNTALAAKKISQQQYNDTSERLEQQHHVALAQIRANEAVTPKQEAQGSIDPVQALANEHAKKLALIQQFETQKGVLTANGLALMNAANTEYEQKRIAAQWELWRNQSTANEALAASLDSLAGNASNAFTGIITGSMSAQDAMQSLASNAISSLINSFVQMGVEWVKSAIVGSTTQIAATGATTAASVAGTATTTAASTAAAAATTAAWTPAAIVASIGSFGGAAAIGIGAVVAAMALSAGIAGKRKNGGPVQAGSLYQVGEGGMPEVYQASNGSQYMIPGDNGKVISNRDMQGGDGGGGGVIVNVNNYGSSQVQTQSARQGNNTVVDVFISDMQNGGPMSRQMQSSFGLRRQATGDY
ncbi:Phage-related minor tail protein [Serratia ficaria]|uniref:tape measure protein n=1 Tax=Serratia ficaria TaxID=61651 RepID=UPI0021829683|nr:tape measure protein [Serratia ficaria]CAI2439816.1 Phage-related minor tail protein [Serratia ficaria]